MCLIKEGGGRFKSGVGIIGNPAKPFPHTQENNFHVGGSRFFRHIKKESCKIQE